MPNSRRQEKLDAFLDEIGARKINESKFSSATIVQEYHAASEDSFLIFLVLRFKSGGFEIFTPASGSNKIEETFNEVRDLLSG